MKTTFRFSADVDVADNGMVTIWLWAPKGEDRGLGVHLDEYQENELDEWLAEIGMTAPWNG